MTLRAIIILCIGFHCSWGQQRVGFWLAADIVRIPFEIVNNSIFVDVALNEHEQLSFIIDTGSNFSVVFTDSLLQIPIQFRVFNIKGFGKRDSLTANISVYNTLSMGALVSYGQQILVVNKDDVDFEQFFDRPLNGIIGQDILKNFNAEFNFGTKTLILRKSKPKKKRGRKWITLPIAISNHVVLVSAVVSNLEHDYGPIYLVMDTGSELPLLLNETFCPPNSVSTIIGLGFLGYASGRVGIIDELRLGNVSIKNIITAFPDSASSRWNSLVPHKGNIGIQFLKRHRVIINYSENYMQLKPIKIFKDPMSYNRSGLAVGIQSDQACPYYISEIAPDSPGAIAGLKKGDRIVKIKDKHCSRLSLDTINQYFFNETRSLYIQILRGTDIKDFVLNMSNNNK